VWLDQLGAGNVVDTGNVTATGNVAWRRGTMTFSPIISATGTVPDSAAADPAGAAADPATAVPDPAVTPDPGINFGQPAGPGTETSHAGSATGEVGSVSDQTDSPARYAGSTGHEGYSADQADTAAGHRGYSADQADTAAEQGAYSADYADTAADSGQADEAGTTWPHQSFLELAALPTAAPCARLHSTLVLWEWQLGALVRTAGLVVSELVGNAVQATAGLTGSRFAGHWAPGTPPVRMWLSADDHRVVIQVWDGSDRPPVPQPVEPEADSGRGLLLVGALSAEWGCYTPEKSSGKVVWAVVTG
jgi:hypothetical protein